MKLIDAFLFYNEEKMLDFRLNYYKDTMDYFIIVEATKTFSGKDKPLYFESIKDRYSHLNIIYYVVDDIPSGDDNWSREHYQRECIKKALSQVPSIQEEDWVLIVDVDEIANRDKLKIVKNSKDWYSLPNRIGYTLEFDMYYYNLTSKMNHKWYQPKLIRYGEIKNKELKGIRHSLHIYPKLIEFGWHFSYFFSPDMIKNKIEAFSHQEYNKEQYTNKEHIEDCIKSGKSLFYLDSTRSDKIIYTPVIENNNLPEGYEALTDYDKN